MATNKFTPTVDGNRFALGFLEDELETLLALSIVLMNRLEDQQKNEDADITAWRLSQVLNEKLSRTTFSDNMRHLLIGNAQP